MFNRVVMHRRVIKLPSFITLEHLYFAIEMIINKNFKITKYMIDDDFFFIG